MPEYWKRIDNYQDYEVSNFGNVKSFKRSYEGELLKPTLSKIGYYRVTLYNGTKRKNVPVHCLVGKHFVDGQRDSLVVDHVDGDPKNNIFTNLQWITQRDNIAKGKAWSRSVDCASRWYKLSFPDGTEMVLKNLTKYARENGIEPRHLHRVASGVRSSYKGIKIEKFIGAL